MSHRSGADGSVSQMDGAEGRDRRAERDVEKTGGSQRGGGAWGGREGVSKEGD